MIELVTANSIYVIGALGFLAFIVSVIVEVTKELPGISRIPTKLWAIIISLIICLFAVFAFSAWRSVYLHWYYIVLSVLCSFVVSYISMYGWDTFKELYDRFKLNK